LSEPGSRLKATSDTLLADLEQLEALEREKRQLTPGDPRLVELATAVEEVARRLLGASVHQRELSAVVNRLVEHDSPAAPSDPIEETHREIHEILADWRLAERRLSEADPASPEALGAQADVDRFREEYRAAHDDARRR
jgi:hypothetical protein